MRIRIDCLHRDAWREWFLYRAPLDRVTIYSAQWYFRFAPFSKIQVWEPSYGWQRARFARFSLIPLNHREIERAMARPSAIHQRASARDES